MGGENKKDLPTLQFPVLPLANATTMDSPEHPLQTIASVPFKWEEQPGKPRPCTDIIVRPEPVGLILELPPCRKHGSSTLTATAVLDRKNTKTLSPTAVLDGPYNLGRPKFSSFRLFVTESVHDKVLESPPDEGITATPVSTTMERMTKKKRGLFGKFGRSGRGKKQAYLGGDEDTLGFSSSSRFSPFSTTTSRESGDEEFIAKPFDGKMRRKRNGGFSDGLSSRAYNINNRTSHFLASIYEGVKQAVHWSSSSSSRKSSKENHI